MYIIKELNRVDCIFYTFDYFNNTDTMPDYLLC